jgi:hypothetical protein
MSKRIDIYSITFLEALLQPFLFSSVSKYKRTTRCVLLHPRFMRSPSSTTFFWQHYTVSFNRLNAQQVCILLDRVWLPPDCFSSFSRDQDPWYESTRDYIFTLLISLCIQRFFRVTKAITAFKPAFAQACCDLDFFSWLYTSVFISKR